MNVKIIFDSVDIIDGIKDSFSVHVSMEEDVFSARVVNLDPSPEMLNGKADAIINTASGEIASFPDGADGVPMKSLVISMQPIQDLHGYSNPWPAGGGKNLLSPDMFIAGNRYINSGNGNPIDPVTGPVWKATDFIFIQPLAGETLTLNHRPYGNVPGIGFYNENKTFISGIANNGASVGSSWTFSVPNGAYYIRLSTMQEYLPEIQLERGATASSWEPYENICPISGRTGLSVTRTGKNLLDKANVLQDLFVKTGTMKIGAIGDTGASVYCPIKGGETYTVSKIASARFTIATTTDLPANNVSINDYETGNSATSLTIQTTENDKYIVAFVYLESADTGKTQQEILDSVQVEKGSTATTYEPYKGNTYSVDWTSEAGTVYGGTDEAVGGGLESTYAMVDLGTLNWGKYSVAQGTLFRTTINDSVDQTSTVKSNALCSAYPTVAQAKRAEGTMSVNGHSFDIIDSRYTNAADFKSSMSGVQLCYELATPVTYQLTPQEVETLKGQNHVWSDAGDVDITYVADTKLYIDNKIAQAIAAALNA